MIEQRNSGVAEILAFRFSGTLHDHDYEIFEPVVEQALAGHGKLRLLIDFEEFHGWDMLAAWDDTKFGIAHYRDFDRIAVLSGDLRCQKWLISWPFTRAEVRYFAADQVDAAWEWLRDGIVLHPSMVEAGAARQPVSDVLAEPGPLAW